MGYDIWVDTDLRGGQDWWEEILRRIADSDAFIAIISRAALTSTACQRECDWAEALARPVLPVVVEPTPTALPRRFARRQIIDYSQPQLRDRAALKLQGGLGTVPPAPPLPDPLPEPPAAPLSYLTDLVDLVARPDPLHHAQQQQILQQLRAAVRSVDPEERRGGRDVLERFASRTDQYADVEQEITRLRQLSDHPAPTDAMGADPEPAQRPTGDDTHDGPIPTGLPETARPQDVPRIDDTATDTASATRMSATDVFARGRWKSRPTVVTAVVLALLLIGVTAVAMQVLGRDGPSTAEPRQESAQPQPANSSPGAAVPAVFVGADCAPLGAAGLTQDGKRTYCAELMTTGDSIWSLYDAQIFTPTATPAPTDEQYPPDIELQVRVCVEQTGLTRLQCREGIQQGNLNGPQ
jgi:hypothetical protein